MTRKAKKGDGDQEVATSETSESTTESVMDPESIPAKTVEAPILMEATGELVATARRNHPLANGRPKRLPVHLLIETTKTSKIVAGAIKADNGWTDETRVTRQEFLARRNAWLTAEV